MLVAHRDILPYSINRTPLVRLHCMGTAISRDESALLRIGNWTGSGHRVPAQVPICRSTVPHLKSCSIELIYGGYLVAPPTQLIFPPSFQQRIRPLLLPTRRLPDRHHSSNVLKILIVACQFKSCNIIVEDVSPPRTSSIDKRYHDWHEY